MTEPAPLERSVIAGEDIFPGAIVFIRDAVVVLARAGNDRPVGPDCLAWSEHALKKGDAATLSTLHGRVQRSDQLVLI